jgi:iron complex transport system ATP-binding protein
MNRKEFFIQGDEIAIGHVGNELSKDAFDVRMPTGKVTALIGPNGAGKTTLIRALLGEDTLIQGKLTLQGRLSYVPQEHRFPPAIRLRDFLRLAFLREAGHFGKLPPDDHPEIISVLSEFALSRFANQVLERLSTGERQRAFLARAILQSSDILLLDEPTNHLDPGGVQRFWSNLLESRKKRHFEVLVSTHDLFFVKGSCDWVCAMKEGRMIFSGPTKECFDSGVPAEIFGLLES